jgi:hypothetical protein
MAWRVLNAMVYHRKSAARESPSTDPLLLRAILKDMTRFQWSLTLKLVFCILKDRPALQYLPKSISDFTQHQAPPLSLLNNTFNETKFRWVLWQSVHRHTAVNLDLSFSAFSAQEV